MKRKKEYDKNSLQKFVIWYGDVLRKYRQTNGVDDRFNEVLIFYKKQVTKIYEYSSFDDSKYDYNFVYEIVDIALDLYNLVIKQHITEATNYMNKNKMSNKIKIYKDNNLEPEVKKFLVHFCGWCIKRLGVTGSFNIILSKKGQIEGISTGGFNPSTNDVICRIEGRAAIDCVRTISHELVHLKQKQDGKIQVGVPVQNIGGDIEDEANAMSGVLVKEYAQKYGRWIYDL